MFHEASSVFGDLLALVIDESAPFDAPLVARTLRLADEASLRLPRAALPVEEIAYIGLLRQQSIESYRAWIHAADIVVGSWRAIESDLALARRSVAALHSFERDPALGALLSRAQASRLAALTSSAERAIVELERDTCALASAADEAIARIERVSDSLGDGR